MTIVVGIRSMNTAISPTIAIGASPVIVSI